MENKCDPNLSLHNTRAFVVAKDLATLREVPIEPESSMSACDQLWAVVRDPQVYDRDNYTGQGTFVFGPHTIIYVLLDVLLDDTLHLVDFERRVLAKIRQRHRSQGIMSSWALGGVGLAAAGAVTYGARKFLPTSLTTYLKSIYKISEPIQRLKQWKRTKTQNEEHNFERKFKTCSSRQELFQLLGEAKNVSFDGKFNNLTMGTFWNEFSVSRPRPIFGKNALTVLADVSDIPGILGVVAVQTSRVYTPDYYTSQEVVSRKMPILDQIIRERIAAKLQEQNEKELTEEERWKTYILTCIYTNNPLHCVLRFNIAPNDMREQLQKSFSTKLDETDNSNLNFECRVRSSNTPYIINLTLAEAMDFYDSGELEHYILFEESQIVASEEFKSSTQAKFQCAYAIQSVAKRYPQFQFLKLTPCKINQRLKNLRSKEWRLKKMQVELDVINRSIKNYASAQQARTERLHSLQQSINKLTQEMKKYEALHQLKTHLWKNANNPAGIPQILQTFFSVIQLFDSKLTIEYIMSNLPTFFQGLSNYLQQSEALALEYHSKQQQLSMNQYVEKEMTESIKGYTEEQSELQEKIKQLREEIAKQKEPTADIRKWIYYPPLDSNPEEKGWYLNVDANVDYVVVGFENGYLEKANVKLLEFPASDDSLKTTKPEGQEVSEVKSGNFWSKAVLKQQQMFGRVLPEFTQEV